MSRMWGWGFLGIWLVGLGGVAWAQEDGGERARAIAVPAPAFAPAIPYTGRTRVFLSGVTDSRFVENRTYLGVTQTGLFNHPRPLAGSEDARVTFERYLQDALRGANLMADSPEGATVQLSVELISIAYSEQTFSASEYGMAEVLYSAQLTPVGERAAPAGAPASLLVRAFVVDSVGDATRHAPRLMAQLFDQAARRLLGSRALRGFLEEDQRALFERPIPASPDLERWLNKSKKLKRTGGFRATAPVDLSAYRDLQVTPLRITDTRYGDRAKTAEGELQQMTNTFLREKLWKKFRSITPKETLGAPPGTLAITGELSDYTPCRPGTQAVMVGLFGVFGLAAGQGHVSGVIRLQDGATGALLVSLPYVGESFMSNRRLVEGLVGSLADFIDRCKKDEPDPELEVSWADG